jgi:hypothetical protein
MWDCSLSTGLPPSSRLRRLWSQKGDLQRAWNRDRKAVWDQVGLSHCRYESLVTVRDETRLRRGHNDDQSHRGHQCSKTSLTVESWFHISPPRGFEPRSLVTGSKGLVHWTSQTWWEWSEIAGSPQNGQFPYTTKLDGFLLQQYCMREDVEFIERKLTCLLAECCFLRKIISRVPTTVAVHSPPPPQPPT